MASESALLLDKHIFICLDSHFTDKPNDHLNFLKANFCGVVITNVEKINTIPLPLDRTKLIYLTGNISELFALDFIQQCEKLFIVKEFSHNYDSYDNNDKLSKSTSFITHGQVSINVNNVGVYWRNAYNSNDKEMDYYHLITTEHKFQNLTESNKPGQAFRKGIYITKVAKMTEVTEQYKFNLLRCSSNFTGPTDNVRDVDKYIMGETNLLAKNFFVGGAELNHVLAQTYENRYAENDKGKIVEKKASIKVHSDKTKDMPRNGLMAFCTFYKDYHHSDSDNNDKSFPELKHVQKSTSDPFDFCYKNTSVLTKLRFRLKGTVKETKEPKELSLIPIPLVKQFDIILYPNSVFMMSLYTNRLYTHEIVPSILPINMLPTRLGYVIRSSKTIAVHVEGVTYIWDGIYIKLEEATKEGIRKIRELYAKENGTDEIIDYGMVNFSMNKGDYEQPLL